MNKDIVIVGCWGHAKSVIEIESTNRWNIIGLISLKNELTQKLLGYEVMGIDKVLEKIREICMNAFITIGQIKDSQKK